MSGTDAFRATSALARRPDESHVPQMRSETIAGGVAVGVGIGTAFGAALDDMGVGIAAGIGVGMALAIGWDSLRKGK